MDTHTNAVVRLDKNLPAACTVVRVRRVIPLAGSRRLGRVQIGDGREVVVSRAEWPAGSLGVHLPPGARFNVYRTGFHQPRLPGGISPSRLDDVFGPCRDTDAEVQQARPPVRVPPRAMLVCRESDVDARQVCTRTFGGVVSFGVLIPLKVLGLSGPAPKPGTDVSRLLGVWLVRTREQPRRVDDALARRETEEKLHRDVAAAQEALDAAVRLRRFARGQRLHPAVRWVADKAQDAAVDRLAYRTNTLHKATERPVLSITRYIVTAAQVAARRERRIAREKAACMALMKRDARDCEQQAASWRAMERFTAKDPALATYHTEAAKAYREQRDSAKRLRKLIRRGTHGPECECGGVR